MDDETNSQKSSGSEYSGEPFHSADFDALHPVPEDVSVGSILFFFRWKKFEGPMLHGLLTVSEGPAGIPFKVPELNAIALRLSAARMSDTGLFYNKALQLARLEHYGFCRVVGCYASDIDRLIIYDETSLLTLHDALHTDGAPRLVLGWNERLQIVQSVAFALRCLHANFTGEEAPHGNLNSSNIIIHTYPDGTYRGLKLFNYGFTNFLPIESYLQAEASPVPEAMEQALCNFRLKIGPAADVYCVGILFLELLTGANPKLVDMYLVRDIMWNNAFDKNNCWGWIQGLHFSLIRDVENLENIHKLLEIAMDCTPLRPHERDVMSNVYSRILDIE